MEGIQQYQRAVTPTVANDGSQVRGKVLSYSARKGSSDVGSGRAPYQAASRQQPQRAVKSMQLGQSLEISGQSKPVAGNRGVLLSATRQDIYGVSSRLNDHDGSREAAKASSYLPRPDLEPLSEEIPPDGILFARYRSRPDSLVVFRLHEERARNPERLNLDRRQLEICPQLEQEQRLRLLNFQNNNIRCIQNVENLPNLIFLDLYNNKIASLDGCLSSVKGLRVLMVGKNRIAEISNLAGLKKLDVLDLHSNDIHEIKGLEGLVDLRVLNLAGNSISIVQNLQSLTSLTELNLRRNCIEEVLELNSIPSLQRVFLSHNLLAKEKSISCLYSLKGLIELSLDANPIAEINPSEYRQLIIAKIPSLKHLDLRRVMDDERAAALFALQQMTASRSSSLLDKAMENAKTENREGKSHSKTKDEVMSHDNSQKLLKSLYGSRSESRPGSPEQIAPAARPRVSSAEINEAGAMGTQMSMQQIISSGESSHSMMRTVPPLVQNAFELEIVGPDEKALLVTGERWEWAHSKRMLAGVTEVTLKQMRKEVICSKFAANLSWIPNATSYTLIETDIRSFSDLAMVLRSLRSSGNVIKSLVIRENSICQVSEFILRRYVLASVPSVVRFNEVEVDSVERAKAVQTFRLLLFSANRYMKETASKLEKVAMASCRGSLSDGTVVVADREVDDGGGSPRSRVSKSAAKTSESSLRTDLEMRYPYKSQPGGGMSLGTAGSNAAGGNSTLVSVTVPDILQMALKRRRAEEKFKKIFENTVDSILLENVEGLLGLQKPVHKKTHHSRKGHL